MNVKIKKFIDQASEYTKIHHNNAYWSMSEEFPEDATWKDKFAELVANECFAAAMQASRGHVNPSMMVEEFEKRIGIKLALPNNKD